MRVVHAVQHHVHRADSEHRLVGVEAGEERRLELVAVLGLVQLAVESANNVLRGGDKEPRRPHRRIGNQIVQRRAHQSDDHVNDVLGRSELSVRTRRRHLLEKFFVNVPHRVLVGQLHRTHVGNDAHKHLRRGDKEHGVLHVAAEGRIVLVAAKPLDELKNIVPHRLKHLRRIGVREAAPPEPLVVARDKRLFGNDALTLLEHRVLHGGSEGIGIRLAHKLVVVQQLHEEQIRDLLHHRDRTCDTRRPEGIPNLVNLPF